MVHTVTMPLAHPAQLVICHERINNARRGAYCALAAYAWCYTCGYYVCDIHMQSRHYPCSTEIEHPGNSSAAMLKGLRPG